MNLRLIKQKPDVIYEMPHRLFRAYLRSLSPEERRIVLAYLNNLEATNEEIAQEVGLPVHTCVRVFFETFQKLITSVGLTNARRSRAARAAIRALRADMPNPDAVQ